MHHPLSTARGRRVALAAAYGGAGLGLLGAASYGVLVAEVRLARRLIPRPEADPPSADGTYGGTPEAAERPLSFVVLGDSSAAGLGVHDAYDTPGAMLAAGIAACGDRPVRLTVVARVGAESYDLERQVTRALQAQPELALVMVGANDVTHRIRPATSVGLLAAAVRRLREAGAAVVVGTCPDLGTVEPIAQPLRTVARYWSRNLAAAQTIATIEAGGRTVSLGDLLGPEFAARPREMFSPDRFHPSAEGYRAAAMALLPSLCASLGLWPEDEGDLHRRRDATPVVRAAVEAAETGGTEVTAARVRGRERGPLGRWTRLRRRAAPVPEPVTAGPAGGAPGGEAVDLPSG